ncbi:MAG: hypothetical protein A3G52_03950 [Candidatus Taylorbacteria bacterium RIFCSPLOWO2_12_FULL_43_20]|uniref:SpoVT-AbrB domain-containing protein n=1 Tax=Candidatus Taylorbacteria bacterium RIFCSPLOWO2_12_FULL_43_20 TaxID=1802332 RepID=A0A1G2P3N0_9BACT|nr:MAG: hypothetical protein A2825_02175 [Candidatus Taylorbacteria bacterium RIFCSPHIGHO2_01_FULL_43_120]OHA22830.1 MAG: hypothetical protein A3B98_01380 [Candidatus Taylorbacteria bacterium RIFCSPHIGHO2_02_FULL_43_55]OHA29389.1 MAG: hypothetical protein A3E92_02525 [Candidatus Taylorbacteria bacterium RIFCSPHIGHO2_12_FULL_42_34]OHA31765.1 MAG: hypothetical protein A3B09_01965 [Candidatus Taylorbacteria bacterium RIFCSPLOWO2_01_FULL_43_83]OHA38580.1 MAG: hypothetical protein A3H58_00250 [Candi
MARRKIEDKNVRSLIKNRQRNSYSLSLPIDIIRRFDWQHRQKLQLTIDKSRKRIIIEDWK